MYCKVYGADTILRKNKKRPFAKEVLKEVKNGEDLFTKLYARNIKEIKQKVKCEVRKNKKNKNRQISKMPNFDVIVEQAESVDSRVLDSFDALLRSSGFPVHVEPVTSSYETKACGKKSNKERKRYSSLEKKDSSLLQVDKENNVIHATANMTCDSKEDSVLILKDKPMLNFKGEKKATLACDSKEDSVIILDDKPMLNFKGKKKATLAEGKRKYMPNLNDSYLSLIEDSYDSNTFLSEFLSRNNRPCSSGKEKSCIKITRGKSSSGTLLRKSSVRESNSSNDSLNIDRSQNSEESQCVPKGRRKSVLKLVSSTPARNVTVEPPCLLSPILPMLKSQYGLHAQKRDNCTKLKTRRKDDRNVSEAEIQLCVNKSSHSSDIDTISQRILHSPDPFAETFKDSESSTDSDEVSNGQCRRASKVKSKLSESVVLKTNEEHYLTNRSSYRTVNKRLTKSRRWSAADSNHDFLTNDFESVGDQHQELSTLGRSRIHSEASIGRPLVPRRSHLVVPLAQSAIDSTWRTSKFREVYCGPALCQSSVAEVSEENIAIGDNKITFKDVVLMHCEQREILSFSEAFSEGNLVDCKKIGEGVYGEVFSRQNADGKSTVMKIMPIEGTCVINGETQKSFEEILPEIVISKELSNLRRDENFSISNFPELIGCWCVQGPFPSQLLNLWHQYDEEMTSENDSPEVLPEDQIYIILELSNVGNAMEGFTFSSAEQSLSAFIQVAYTLAIAEAALEFEHRDLHWGNILIKHTKEKSISCKIYGEDHILPTHGIQASVIDFTLSRITYDGCCIYNNLAEDPALFEGKGDYQFDMYRMMREQINENWEVFQPYNNVLWLSYVLEKLISEVYYRCKTSFAHRKAMNKLRTLREKILDFKSAVDVALSFD